MISGVWLQPAIAQRDTVEAIADRLHDVTGTTTLARQSLRPVTLRGHLRASSAAPQARFSPTLLEPSHSVPCFPLQRVGHRTLDVH